MPSKYYVYAVDSALKRVGILLNINNLFSVVNDLEWAIKADKESQEKLSEVTMEIKELKPNNE